VRDNYFTAEMGNERLSWRDIHACASPTNRERATALTVVGRDRDTAAREFSPSSNHLALVRRTTTAR